MRLTLTMLLGRAVPAHVARAGVVAPAELARSQQACPMVPGEAAMAISKWQDVCGSMCNHASSYGRLSSSLRAHVPILRYTPREACTDVLIVKKSCGSRAWRMRCQRARMPQVPGVTHHADVFNGGAGAARPLDELLALVEQALCATASACVSAGLPRAAHPGRHWPRMPGSAARTPPWAG